MTSSSVLTEEARLAMLLKGFDAATFRVAALHEFNEATRNNDFVGATFDTGQTIEYGAKITATYDFDQKVCAFAVDRDGEKTEFWVRK